MTVPIPGTAPVAPTQCRHCTVPITDSGDVCGFCATYTPPATAAQRLDVAVNRIDLLRHDLNQELQGLPSDSPLWVTVDLVRAQRYLRAAAALIDKASTALEADAATVTQ